MKRIFAALAVTMVSLSASANDEDLAVGNLASEYAVCAAYYAIVSECLKNRTDTDWLIAKTEQLSDHAMMRSFKLSNPETTKARCEVAVRTMSGAIDGNCSNISRIVVAYGESCTALLEHPDARLEQLRREAKGMTR